MIVSASRRTDIPGYHMPWLMERLREGFAVTRNPMNAHQERIVDLSPKRVDAIIFWTKHPGGLQGHLAALAPYRFYVQCTLNDYPPGIEPGVALNDQRVEDIRRLADALGPERIVWRYDPILLDPKHTPEAHIDAFARLAHRLAGAVDEAIISFLDDYARIRKRLSALLIRTPTVEEQRAMAKGLAEVARSHGLRISACCEPEELTALGIARARCIDAERIARLWGREIRPKRDTGQRPGCGCAPSVDIGTYGTCPGGCVYCYARGFDGTKPA